MAQQIGKGHVFGAPAVLTAYEANGTTAISGYVSPTLNGASLTHSFDTDETRNQAGDIDSLLVGMGEKVECEFDFIPRGSTVANAKISATLPPIGARVDIASAPVIRVGSFTDVYNTGGSNTQPWIYVGGGSLTESAGGKMTGKIKLARFYSITSAAPIS